jgi:hypothetical protein
VTFFCAADPGTTTNAFSFAAVEMALSRAGREIWIVRHLQSWQGRPGAPLDVRNVQGPACCRLAYGFGCESILTDIHEHGSMVNAGMTWMGGDHAKPGIAMPLDAGDLSVTTADFRVVLHDSTGCRVFFGPEIADDMRERVGKQLASVTYKGDGGRVKIVWPTEGTGHGDEARAVVRALRHGRAGRAADVEAEPWQTVNAAMISDRSAEIYGAHQQAERAGADIWHNPRR